MVAFYTILVTAELGGMNPYARSYQSRIGMYADKLDSLTRISSWDVKMKMRHVANAEIPAYIVSHLREGDTVLLPPRSYANKYMEAEAIWTDPRIFTYFVDFQPIVGYTDLNRRSSANTFVVLEGNTIWLARRGGTTNIDSLLSEYAR